MLDLLVNEKKKIEKIIVASSMSIYGEGQYLCADHGFVYPKLHLSEQFETRDWEMKCPDCSKTAMPSPTWVYYSLYPTKISANSDKFWNRVGFSPQVSIEYGVQELVEWANTQQADDKVEVARDQLFERNLVK